MMTPHIRISLLACFLSLLSIPAVAQFQYIGASGQFLLAPTRGSQVIGAVSWLMQVSAHHGFGVEVGLPFYLSSSPMSQYDDLIDPRFMLISNWRRSMSPTLSVRYRYYLGNSPFLGLSVGAGAISEFIFVQRDHQSGNFWQPEVPAVDISQSIRSPFFRITAESGITPNMGKRMYALIQAGIGLQVTAPPVSSFGEVALDEGEPYRLRPYHGKDIFGNFQLGMGVKL